MAKEIGVTLEENMNAVPVSHYNFDRTSFIDKVYKNL